MASLPFANRTQNEQIVKYAPDRGSILPKVGTNFSDAAVYLGGVKKRGIQILRAQIKKIIKTHQKFAKLKVTQGGF